MDLTSPIASGLVASEYTDDPALVNGVTCYYVITATDDTESDPSGAVAGTPADTIRINAGGGVITSTDAGPNWSADGAAGSQSPYLFLTGSANVSSNGGVTGGLAPGVTAPISLYLTERWSNNNFGYSFPTPSGTAITVKLYLASTYQTAAGVVAPRVFDVLIDGVEVITDLNLNAGSYTHRVGYGFTVAVTSDSDWLDLEWVKNLQDNPLLNAIEVTLTP